MGMIEHGAHLFDMHCHLGFVDDVEAVRRCLHASGIHALSCTVLPTEYEQETETFSGLATCTVALGLHPWYVTLDTASAAELARFETLAPTTRFIGEIGLDYAGERSETTVRGLQRDAFSQVLAACDIPSTFPHKLLSIHAVQAANDVMDLLEAHETFTRHDCIFHWFAGTPEELKRAIAADCYFSIGPRMLATKRGREYARIIPTGRLLLETDSPSYPDEPWNRAAWTTSLSETLTAIAKIRKSDRSELAHAIERTSERLLRRA